MADPYAEFRKTDPYAEFQGATIGPKIPQGNQPPTLPNVTNSDLAGWGKKALSFAPLAGATAATTLAPELSIPAMAGIAALGGAGGEGIRQGVLSLTGAPERSRSPREAAINIGEAGLEQGLGELGGRLAAIPLGWAASRLSPTRLYGSALKPSPSISPADRKILIDTGLSESIPVTNNGLINLQNVRQGLGQKVSDIISTKSGQPGTDIHPIDVAKAVDDIRSKFAQQVTPESDLSAIDRAKQEFLNKHSTPAPFTGISPNPYAAPGGPGQFVSTGTGATRMYDPIPLGGAQAEKTGTYRVLSGKYGELGSADTEAQKALARGYRQEIEKRVPEVGPLNEREGRLIDLEGPLARSLNREDNRQLVGLRLPLVDAPTVTSSAAILMNKFAKNPAGKFLGPYLRPSTSAPFLGRTAANVASRNK